MYFVYLYENRTVEPVKIILNRGSGMWEKDVRDEPN
jgi:hypothetical protein